MNKGFMGGHIGVIGTGKLGSCAKSALGKGCPPGMVKNARGNCVSQGIPTRASSSGYYAVGSRKR